MMMYAYAFTMIQKDLGKNAYNYGVKQTLFFGKTATLAA